MVTQSTRVSSHSSPYESSLLDRQEDLWTRTWWPCGWSGRECGHLVHISECHSSSSSSSWTRLWGEFTMREEASLVECGTVIQWKWKTDQWTNRDHWCKHNSFHRTHVDVGKLIVQQSLSDHQRQNLRVLRLCALCMKMGEDPIATWNSKIQWVFGKESLQGYESNRWYAVGVWVENIPRDHNVGPPRTNSKPNERSTVWTWTLQRQDHLHVNVQRQCMGRERKYRKMFEWKIFPGLTTMKILNQIQQMMGELQCEPENFTGRIIFMSMFNDIVWDAKGNDETRENNSKIIEPYARGFPCGHWSFPGPGSEKKWYGTYDHKPDGSWDRTAEKMLQNFAESGHQIFRCTSALERGELRSKGGGKTSIHFNGSTQNVESSPLINSVFTEQWRIWLKNYQLGRDLRGNPLHQFNCINKKFLHNLLSQKCKPVKSDRETCCKKTSNDLKNCGRPKVIQLRSRFEISRNWTILLCSSVTKRKKQINLCAENFSCLEIKKELV